MSNARRIRDFERGDLVLAPHRAGDVVETVHERLLRVRVERELELEPVRMRDAQALEVDRQLVARGDRLLDPRELAGRERDRREAAQDRVLPEDVAERRRQHRAEAVVLERPRRMLARRAAAEVAAGEQDRRAGIAVQLEARVLHPVEEDELAVAGRARCA